MVKSSGRSLVLLMILPIPKMSRLLVTYVPMADYVPPSSGDPPGLPTGDPSIVGDASGAPDEQQTQQDPPVETDGEDEDESPDFVTFPDDQSSVHDEDHRSASRASPAFNYGSPDTSPRVQRVCGRWGVLPPR